jgi:hypothetical protein
LPATAPSATGAFGRTDTLKELEALGVIKLASGEIEIIDADGLRGLAARDRFITRRLRARSRQVARC